MGVRSSERACRSHSLAEGRSGSLSTIRNLGPPELAVFDGVAMRVQLFAQVWRLRGTCHVASAGMAARICRMAFVSPE